MPFVVEVFDLTDIDARLSFGILAFDRPRIGAGLSIMIFSRAPHRMTFRSK
jgi:hypothetical protein